jgi:hypothetical protein
MLFTFGREQKGSLEQSGRSDDDPRWLAQSWKATQLNFFKTVQYWTASSNESPYRNLEEVEMKIVILVLTILAGFGQWGCGGSFSSVRTQGRAISVAGGIPRVCIVAKHARL